MELHSKLRSLIEANRPPSSKGGMQWEKDLLLYADHLMHNAGSIRDQTIARVLIESLARSLGKTVVVIEQHHLWFDLTGLTIILPDGTFEVPWDDIGPNKETENSLGHAHGMMASFDIKLEHLDLSIPWRLIQELKEKLFTNVAASQQLLDNLRDGYKIKAIRDLREMSGLGLGPAKAGVEWAENELAADRVPGLDGMIREGESRWRAEQERKRLNGQED